MEFDTDEELKEYIKNYNKGYEENRWENDSRISKAYKLADDEPVWDDCWWKSYQGLDIYKPFDILIGRW